MMKNLLRQILLAVSLLLLQQQRTLAGTGLGLPHIARAADPVKIGLIHPATGFLAYPLLNFKSWRSNGH